MKLSAIKTLAGRLMLAASTAPDAAGTAKNMLGDVINILTTVVMIGGGIWLIFGVIALAGGLKDQNGPETQKGIWQCLGGFLIMLAVGLFKYLVY